MDRQNHLEHDGWSFFGGLRGEESGKGILPKFYSSKAKRVTYVVLLLQAFSEGRLSVIVVVKAECCTFKATMPSAPNFVRPR